MRHCLISCILQPRGVAAHLTSCTKLGDVEENEIRQEDRQRISEERGGETTEWVAEEEEGVLITFLPIPSGGNILKKIRFNEELFDETEAKQWLTDNWERIVALYNVHNTAVSSSQDQVVRDSSGASEWQQREGRGMDNSADFSSGEGQTHRQVHDKEGTEIVEYQPGVFLTFRSFPNGRKYLLCVQLSTAHFGGQVKAQVWWKENGKRFLQQFCVNSMT